MRHSAAAAGVAAAATAAPALRAQSFPAPAAPASSVWQFLADSSRAAWLRPAASLVIPGSGQLLGRAERGALYLAAEAFVVTRYVSLHRDAGRAAAQYRDLAFKVARAAFAPQVRDTAFEYFEAMAKYLESGPFSVGSGSELVPPQDERTFNGRIWLLARQTFFKHPDSLPDPNSLAYQRALEFYRRRAVGPGFRWSWRGAAIEQDLFRQTIRASDEAFRHARDQLGLLLANHLLSAIDAWVANRLGGRSRFGRVSAGAGLPLARCVVPESPGARGLWLRLTATF